MDFVIKTNPFGAQRKNQLTPEQEAKLDEQRQEFLSRKRKARREYLERKAQQ